MKVYMMRHGWAGPSINNNPRAERERPLLPEGRDTVRAIARTMATLDEVPRVIFSSPFQRAIDTADEVGKILGVQVNVIGEMAPMRPLEDGILGILRYGEVKRPLFVVHVDNSSPAMRKFDGDVKWEDLVMSEVRRVRMDRHDGDWELRWGLKPSDIGKKDHDK